MTTRFLTFVFSLFALLAQAADPPESWDSFSKQQADQLVDWVKKNPFIMYYCDYCHDADIKARGKSREVVTLFHISQAEAVRSESEPDKYSVKMKFMLMSESKVNKDGEIVSTDQFNPSFDAPFIYLSLNYHFTSRDNLNVRIYEEMRWVDGLEANPCGGLMGFPNPAEFSEDLGKKYQKWATKRGNFWQ